MVEFISTHQYISAFIFYLLMLFYSHYVDQHFKNGGYLKYIFNNWVFFFVFVPLLFYLDYNSLIEGWFSQFSVVRNLVLVLLYQLILHMDVKYWGGSSPNEETQKEIIINGDKYRKVDDE